MMARILGYNSVEELKRGCLLSRHYAVPDCRSRTLEKAAEKGTIQNAEARLIRKDGQDSWIRFSGIMKVEEGFIEGVAVDITRIKQVEAAFKRTNRLMAREHHKRKRLSHKLITELERNQRRLAMELHDQVGQELTTLKMDFELALNRGEEASDRSSDLERLARGRDRVVRTIQTIRSLCAGLRPFVLDDLGVIPAIRELCKQIQDQTGIEIHLFTGNIPERLSPDIELAVYRIAQEALTNIVRHAEAGEVFVNLVLKTGRIILSVEDNGKGFDSQGPKGRSIQHDGLGLFIMEERAIQMGGRFHIDSRPGKGTLLWADFPSGHTDGTDRFKETP